MELVVVPRLCSDHDTAQCLWKTTTEVGMGKATAEGGATYVVARYTPQGNMAGEKPF